MFDEDTLFEFSSMHQFGPPNRLELNLVFRFCTILVPLFYADDVRRMKGQGTGHDQKNSHGWDRRRRSSLDK